MVIQADGEADKNQTRRHTGSNFQNNDKQTHRRTDRQTAKEDVAGKYLRLGPEQLKVDSSQETRTNKHSIDNPIIPLLWSPGLFPHPQSVE